MEMQSLSFHQAHWRPFVKALFEKTIRKAAASKTAPVAVDINLAVLRRENPESYELLTSSNPALQIDVIQEELARLWLEENHKRRGTFVRLSNAPPELNVPSNELRVQHTGQLVKYESTPAAIGHIRPWLVWPIYQCQRCSAIHDPWNEDHAPRTCSEEIGGCGQRTTMTLLREESGYIDAQTMELRSTRGGEGGSPKILADVRGPLAGTLEFGKRYFFTGIVQTIADEKPSKLDSPDQFLFMVHDIEPAGNR